MYPNPTQIYQVHLILPSLCRTSTAMGEPEAGGGAGGGEGEGMGGQ